MRSSLRLLCHNFQAHKTGWRAHVSRSNKFGALEIWNLQDYGGRRNFCCVIDQKERLSKQEEALQATLKEISKTFGVEAVTWLGRASTTKAVPVIPTGSLTLDIALGIGGLPKGRVVEIFGSEGSGKTTLALHVIAEAQKIGGHCVFVDAQHSFDCAHAEAVGVQMGRLFVARPDNVEQAFAFVEKFIKTMDVIVVDNVAAFFHKVEETKEASIPLQARLLSQTLRKLTHSISANKTLLIFINQTRSKFSTHGYLSQENVNSGGNALKCYSSIRLNVQNMGDLGKIGQGSNTVVKVVKNKLAPPFKTAEFEIEPGKGISKEGEVLDQAVKHGIVVKSGSVFFYNGASIGEGRENAKIFMRENTEIQEALALCIKDRMGRVARSLDTELDG